MKQIKLEIAQNWIVLAFILIVVAFLLSLFAHWTIAGGLVTLLLFFSIRDMRLRRARAREREAWAKGFERSFRDAGSNEQEDLAACLRMTNSYDTRIAEKSRLWDKRLRVARRYFILERLQAFIFGDIKWRDLPDVFNEVKHFIYNQKIQAFAEAARIDRLNDLTGKPKSKD